MNETTTEFVVFDKFGKEIDWCDPVIGHTEANGWHFVDNGFNEYSYEIPEGGRWEIRERSEHGYEYKRGFFRYGVFHPADNFSGIGDAKWHRRKIVEWEECGE